MNETLSFMQLVEKNISTGVSRSEAISRTAHNHPAAHQAYIQEANRPKAAQVVQKTPALISWDNVVAAARSEGMTATEAVNHCVRSYPAIHSAAFRQ